MDWKVPTNWDLGRIGGFYSLRNEKVSDKDYPPLSVTMKGILPQLETAAKTNDGDNRKLVRKGDLQSTVVLIEEALAVFQSMMVQYR